jgi:hypothetical protein
MGVTLPTTRRLAGTLSSLKNQRLKKGRVLRATLAAIAPKTGLPDTLVMNTGSPRAKKIRKTSLNLT